MTLVIAIPQKFLFAFLILFLVTCKVVRVFKEEAPRKCVGKGVGMLCVFMLVFRWEWVTSFMLWLLYPQGKRLVCSLNIRLGIFQKLCGCSGRQINLCLYDELNQLSTMWLVITDYWILLSESSWCHLFSSFQDMPYNVYDFQAWNLLRQIKE